MIHQIKLKSIKLQTPSETVSTNSKWVNYGPKNSFPEYIIDLLNNSAMNRTCVMSKLDGVVGKGLYVGENPLEQMANPKETWNKVLVKLAYDYIVFGGFALNIIWSNDGETIAEVYHVDFSTIRSGEAGPEDEVEFYYYSRNWKKATTSNKPKQYRAYNKEKSLEFPSQILYHFDYSPGLTYYPIPSYNSAINDITIDIQTSRFHTANLENGLNPTVFIQMNNGIPSPEERQVIYQEIADGFSGAENAGKFFLSFAPDKEHGTEITPITSTNDQYYIALDSRVSSRILTAHRITSPLLLGIKDGGSSLGSNKDEILVAYEHFISTVIKPISNSILEVISPIISSQAEQELDLSIPPQKLFAE